MLCFVFVIALILPSLAYPENGEKKNKTINCDDPRVIESGDKFFACFDIIVNNAIKNENKTCVTSLSKSIKEFIKVANETCYRDNQERTSLYLRKMTNVSLSHGSYKDFIAGGGVNCIDSIKPKITKCVNTAMGKTKGADNHSKYDTLWKNIAIVNLDSKPCKESFNIKECTLNEMRKSENINCRKTESVLYVSSLFDYIQEQCIRARPMIEPSSPGHTAQVHNDIFLKKLVKDTKTTHILLALMLVLALVGILYVLGRDCRISSRWKNLNEQLEMRQRHRSLVNNEVCQRP